MYSKSNKKLAKIQLCNLLIFPIFFNLGNCWEKCNHFYFETVFLRISFKNENVYVQFANLTFGLDKLVGQSKLNTQSPKILESSPNANSGCSCRVCRPLSWELHRMWLHWTFYVKWQLFISHNTDMVKIKWLYPQHVQRLWHVFATVTVVAAGYCLLN